MKTNNKATLKSECGVGRMKYWKECSSEEKIERLREEIKRRDYVIDKLLRLADEFRCHEHNKDGNILIRISPEQIGHIGLSQGHRTRDDDGDVYL